MQHGYQWVRISDGYGNISDENKDYIRILQEGGWCIVGNPFEYHGFFYHVMYRCEPEGA